ncbi:helix-turn-helix domain-containing protein [Streptomyces antnestii]|nr:helix-turn-helix domain-containing protein [Streptomyces sp. San01]
MSETRTLHAVPAPEPLTGLTGAPAAIYTALISNPGATATELALAACIGRSTAGKALTTLEEHGLAIRKEGERTGARRTPDRWSCAQSEPTDTEAIDDTVSAAPDESSTTDSVCTNKDTQTDTSPTSAAEPDTGAAAQSPAQVEAPNVPKANKATGAPDPDDACTNPEAPKPSAQPPTHTATAKPVAVLVPKTRMAPGALRQRVIEHLQAHPEEAFTATRISRVIERSSGAIANALVILARQGIAQQVSDTPRTYRHATPEADTE